MLSPTRVTCAFPPPRTFPFFHFPSQLQFVLQLSPSRQVPEELFPTPRVVFPCIPWFLVPQLSPSQTRSSLWFALFMVRSQQSGYVERLRKDLLEECLIPSLIILYSCAKNSQVLKAQPNIIQSSGKNNMGHCKGCVRAVYCWDCGQEPRQG